MSDLNFKTTKDVAEIFHMSEISQWRARKAGELDFYRIGGKILYSESQLREFAERRLRHGVKQNAAKVAA